jgi:hypothetical protein
MARAEDYAAWIVANKGKQGTPEFETVAKAYQMARDQAQRVMSNEQPKLSDQIPNVDPRTGAPVPVEETLPTTQAERGMGERIAGAAEAGLSLATGAVGGTVGMIGGTAKGLVDSVRSGTYGTQQGVAQVEQAAAEGMQALTYAPRTEAGREYVGEVGEVLAETVPLTGLTAEMAVLGKSAGLAGQAARTRAQAIPASIERIRAASPAIAERVERVLRRNPEPARKAGGAAGAQGSDVATMRRDAAESLPVPIDLTEGQATREHMQLQFEKETAKLEGGAKLRERAAEQNEKIIQNFDAWVDMTGAEAPSLRAVGKTVDAAVVKKAARDKTEIRTAYQKADAAGEMEAPVTLDNLVAHLNESAPDAATAPLLVTARGRAIQLGVAAEDGNGNLVPLPTSLKNAERYRQAISRATDYEATNIRQSAIIKGAIDGATESVGGELYRAARRMRENYARQYENHDTIANMLSNKHGKAERKVAFEDVFHHAILKGSLDEVRHVRRVLQTGGEEGMQAWRELQGATIRWIKDEATKGVSSDTRGNPIVSADKVNKALRELDADGKLEFLFGKKGAEQMRDMNDLIKLVHTAPPGVVNTSNTAATVLAAIGEAGAAGAITGLPVPVLTLLRALARRQKDVRLQKKIDAALARRPRQNPPQDR